MKINMAGLAAALAGVGHIKEAKDKQDDDDTLKALRERQMALQESQAADARSESMRRGSQEDQRLAQDSDRIGLERSQRDLSQKQFDLQSGEIARKTQEEHLGAAAVRSQLDRQYHIKTDAGMTLDTLDKMLSTKMGEDARMHEIEETKKYNASQQLQAASRQMVLARAAFATVGRLRQDTFNSIMSDPAYLPLYAAGMKAKDPNLMKNLFIKKTGRDLDAEYNMAAMNVANIQQQAYVLTGQSNPGTPPASAKALQDALPFGMKSPEQQASIAAEYTAKMKAGQPIDMKKAYLDGVPVQQIAESNKLDLNLQPGAQTAIPAPVAAPVNNDAHNAMLNGINSTAQTMGFGPGLGTMAGAIGSMMGGQPQAAPTPATASPVAPTATTTMTPGAMNLSPTAPAPSAPAGEFNVNLGPGGQPAAAGRGNSPDNGFAGAWQTINGPDRNATVGAGGVNLGPGVQPPAAGMGNSAIVGNMQAAAAANFATPPGSAGQGYALQRQLNSARSLPEAETTARSMLDLGMNYDEVIAHTPPKYQSMLSAKLPKRIPQSQNGPNPTPPALAPAAAPPPFTPVAPSPFQSPFGQNSLAPNRPLFSPPNI